MTTLTEARKSLLQLTDSLPADSTYANHLAVLSDYFDKQVPLNIENNNLMQRLARAEGFVTRVRDQSALMVEKMAAVTPLTAETWAVIADSLQPLHDNAIKNAMRYDIDAVKNPNGCFGKFAADVKK